MATKRHSINMSQIEEETLNLILKMENEFRDFYATLLKEMKFQQELLERMWFLSQRYMILDSTGPCWKFSEVYSAPADETILQEYSDKLQQIRSSNCRLWNALRVVRKSLLQFRCLCSQMDMTKETPFIMGDTFHKPLSYFVELVEDCFKYMHALLLSFKGQAHLMDPIDPIQLEEYKKILQPSEDFEEYLMQGLLYCKCLRPKNSNCEPSAPLKKAAN